jgi:diguanylate cyclase (GGDEF)-like protein
MEKTMEFAQQLLKEVQEASFTFAQTHIPLTISAGVADVTIFDTDTASVIARADKALYKAKAEGRNRVVRL